MTGDASAPCVARTSAAIVLKMQDIWAVVFARRVSTISTIPVVTNNMQVKYKYFVASCNAFVTTRAKYSTIWDRSLVYAVSIPDIGNFCDFVN